MINGLLYGLVYFSLLPSLILALARFDLSFYPVQTFQTIKYELNHSLLYVYISIAIIFLILISIKRKSTQNVAETNIISISNIRKQKIFFTLLISLGIAFEFIDFIYMDQSQHWLERERLNILPPTIRFYINPLFMFGTFISIINIASSISLIRQKKYNLIFKKNILIWIFIDTSYILLTIYNSGNRWFLAVIAIFYFYISPKNEKIKIGIISPLLIIAGGMISFAILANRVGIEISQTISTMLSFDNFYHSFLTSMIAVTEGFNITTLIMLAEKKLTDFDLVYPFYKIISLPLPGSFFEKPPPFNQLVAEILTNEKTELSLGIGILGIFFYAFGVASLFVFIYFIFTLNILDKKISNQKIQHYIWFCLFLSGYRFGFEYLIVHFIYFTIIQYIFLPIKTTKAPHNQHTILHKTLATY